MRRRQLSVPIGKDMGMPSDHFPRDRLDHIAERKRVLLFGHAGVKHDLQQEVAELVAQIVEIAARDRVGDFIGFLDGVGRDRRKILFEIPRTATARRAQLRHDVEETGDIAGRGHGTPKARGDRTCMPQDARLSQRNERNRRRFPPVGLAN